MTSEKIQYQQNVRGYFLVETATGEWHLAASVEILNTTWNFKQIKSLIKIVHKTLQCLSQYNFFLSNNLNTNFCPSRCQLNECCSLHVLINITGTAYSAAASHTQTCMFKGRYGRHVSYFHSEAHTIDLIFGQPMWTKQNSTYSSVSKRYWNIAGVTIYYTGVQNMANVVSKTVHSDITTARSLELWTTKTGEANTHGIPLDKLSKIIYIYIYIYICI